MKKKWLGAVLGTLVVFSLPSSAITTWDMTDAFDELGGSTASVSVHSWVEPLVTAQFYRYNYEITSTSVNINWFSVGLLQDCGLTGSRGVTATIGGRAPLLWDFMDTPASSITALFQPQVAANGKSYILSFESWQAPTVGSAMVSGNTNTQFHSLVGNVFTPIPEPVTVTLLALGAVLIGRKRKLSD
ncbi:MAG: hypothetical protein LLF76_00885 [Planctomycetaceae bacterium]|nr:hypothetical protein [Planctomycetaceae bacterium]